MGATLPSASVVRYPPALFLQGGIQKVARRDAEKYKTDGVIQMHKNAPLNPTLHCASLGIEDVRCRIEDEGMGATLPSEFMNSIKNKQTMNNLLNV